MAFLEARHRAHARVEDVIRNAEDTGLGRLPSRDYGINTAWLLAVGIAADLTAWLRLLALPEALKTCELWFPGTTPRTSKTRTAAPRGTQRLPTTHRQHHRAPQNIKQQPRERRRLARIK
ncbi:hypothetical protein BN11_4510024 [Nostocoides australiense Ben110]|uniref:Uncharacterized protein n=1 Tax=Nostocoides australiense Ben110 TaxID=1193182 RepID=W6JYB8_9MICO|nr:transposase [Tetrasphaera australiensis]CCH74523.1 hypothetical protein BN11_4510024 [Tetrasphaera australiensis Ben110]